MCLRETLVYLCGHSDRRPDLIKCPMAIESNLTRCPMLQSRAQSIPTSCRECLDRGARQGDETRLQTTLNTSRNEFQGWQRGMGAQGDDVFERLRGLSLNEFEQQAEAQLQRDIQATLQASANKFEARQIAMGAQDIERLRGLSLRDFEAQAEAQMMRDIEATKQASINEMEAKGFVFGEEQWQDRGKGYDEQADRKMKEDIEKAMKASILDAVSKQAVIDDGGAVSTARPMGSMAYGEGGSSRAPQAQATANAGRKGSIAAGKAPATGKAGPSFGKPGPQYGKPGPTFGNANTTIHRPNLGNSDDADNDEDEQLRPPVEWMVDPRDAATGKFFGPPVWTAPAPEVDPFEETHGAGQTLGGAASKKLDPRAAARERWNRVARTLPRVKPEPPPKALPTMEDAKKSARKAEAQRTPVKQSVAQQKPVQPNLKPKIEQDKGKKPDPRNTSARQSTTSNTSGSNSSRQPHQSSRSHQPQSSYGKSQSATKSKPTSQSQSQAQTSLASLWLKSQASGGKAQAKPEQKDQSRQAAPSTSPIWDRRAAARPQPVSIPGSAKPRASGSESKQTVPGKIGTYQPQTQNMWQPAGAPPTRPAAQPVPVQTAQAEEDDEESDDEIDTSPEAMRARRMRWLDNMKKGKPQDE